ncbi:hypothetical protein Btru_028311 [Bulinus truncatus]|nr:hypothetical protein Btru_028311 [Bulinus truncatus]
MFFVYKTKQTSKLTVREPEEPKLASPVQNNPITPTGLKRLMQKTPYAAKHNKTETHTQDSQSFTPRSLQFISATKLHPRKPHEWKKPSFQMKMLICTGTNDSIEAVTMLQYIKSSIVKVCTTLVKRGREGQATKEFRNCCKVNSAGRAVSLYQLQRRKRQRKAGYQRVQKLLWKMLQRHSQSALVPVKERVEEGGYT